MSGVSPTTTYPLSSAWTSWCSSLRVERLLDARYALQVCRTGVAQGRYTQVRHYLRRCRIRIPLAAGQHKHHYARHHQDSHLQHLLLPAPVEPLLHIRRQPQHYHRQRHAAQHQSQHEQWPARLRLVDADLAQPPPQHAGVQQRRQRGSQRQTDVGQRPDQDQVHHHIGGHADDGDAHRSFHVLPGKVAGGQHLDQHEGHHPDGVGTQGVGRLDHVPLGHRAIVEQSGDQRSASSNNANAAGMPTSSTIRTAQSRWQQGFGVFPGMLTGRCGQDHGTDGDTEGAQWQFRQTVGVICQEMLPVCRKEAIRCRAAG